MRKTILVVLMILALVPAGLFAGILSLSLGATAQYNGAVSVADELEWQDGFEDIENWAFGPDIRLRLLFAEVGLAGLYSSIDDGHQLSGILTGGVSFDLLGLLRIGLGMGPRMSVQFDSDFANPTVMIAGTPETDVDFSTAFMNAPMTYRATADLKLGKLLFGLSYIIDSAGFTFEEQDWEKMLPDFEAGGTVGVSLLYTLF
ncbi:MAG: hypothetical protein ACOXZ4_02330 [Sphaerochaetaceae bacterium]